jgi:hypothetical protein
MGLTSAAVWERSAADDAAEAEVAGGGVDRLGLAGRGPVAKAVVRRAQVGSALDHLGRGRSSRWPFGLVTARRAPWPTTGGRPGGRGGGWRHRRGGGCVTAGVILAGPLPDIAGDIDAPGCCSAGTHPRPVENGSPPVAVDIVQWPSGRGGSTPAPTWGVPACAASREMPSASRTAASARA